MTTGSRMETEVVKASPKGTDGKLAKAIEENVPRKQEPEPVDGTGSTGPQHFAMDEGSDDDDDHADEFLAAPSHNLLGEELLGQKPTRAQTVTWYIVIIFGSLALIGCGAWFGVRFAASRHIRQMEMDALNTDAHVADRATADVVDGCSADGNGSSTCKVTNTVGTVSGGGVSGDERSSQSSVQSAPDVAQQSSGTHIPAAAKVAASASSSNLAKGDPAGTTPSEQQASPAGSAAAQGGGAVASDAGLQYPDLTCMATQRVEWIAVKALTAEWFGSWKAGVVAKDKTQLQGLLDIFMQRLEAAVQDTGEECGMGRLCMTLLALSSGESGASLKMAPSFHSPLLTILLDVPWLIVMQSGWPLFGLLAQLQMQQHKRDDMPVSGASQHYLTKLRQALVQEQAETIAELGSRFVVQQEEAENRGPSAESEETKVMPALCALASQLLGNGVLVGGPPGSAEKALGHMQAFYRQAVTNIDDLQATLDSVWPLYSILSQAAVIAAPPPTATR
eukprot:TRINITY_DN26659_c1_g2_i1.p1 TRINITY_DN26659_c1_g2~~TRINITY_DN26659_c1_g2_i1.p1  ORF type:complete len:506 (+),score=112.44 TRINITY_DN26659_c1_g2_i1:196-1713(+)